MRRPVIVIVLGLAASSACQAPPDSDAAGWPCASDQPPVTAIESADGARPAWRLLAVPEWEEHPYAVGMEFSDDAPASAGCGTVGSDTTLLGFSGGGFEFDGRQVRYVYGAVLPPVASVRVTYKDAEVVHLTPVALDGFKHQFFAHATEAPSGFSVEALDKGGAVIAGR